MNRHSSLRLDDDDGIHRDLAEEMLGRAICAHDRAMLAGKPTPFDLNAFTSRLLESVERYEKKHPPSTQS